MNIERRGESSVSVLRIHASRSDEILSPLWKIEGNGWYNMSPAFFEDYRMIVEKEYEIGGAAVYSVDVNTALVKSS